METDMMKPESKGGLPALGPSNQSLLQVGQPTKDFPPEMVGRVRSVKDDEKVPLSADDFLMWATQFSLAELKLTRTTYMAMTVRVWKGVQSPAERFFSVLRSFNVQFQGRWTRKPMLVAVAMLSARQALRFLYYTELNDLGDEATEELKKAFIKREQDMKAGKCHKVTMMTLPEKPSNGVDENLIPTQE